MNLSVIKHIEHFYPNPVYSEVYYLAGDPITGTASANYSQTGGARAILIQYIYFTTNNAGGLITFTDQYNNVIFTATNTGILFYWAPIFAIKKGAQVKITCSVPVLDFSIAYQYII